MASAAELSVYLRLNGSADFDRDLGRAQRGLVSFADQMRPLAMSMAALGGTVTAFAALSVKTFVDSYKVPLAAYQKAQAEYKKGTITFAELQAAYQAVNFAAKPLSDSMDTLHSQFAEMQKSIASALAPSLIGLFNVLTNVVKRVSEWAQANPALVKTIAAFGMVLVGAGGIIIALGQVAKAVNSINIALAIMKGLSGPEGWAQLAAGIAIAGGAIYAINKMQTGSGGSSASAVNVSVNGVTSADDLAAQLAPAISKQLTLRGQRNATNITTAYGGGY